MASKRDNPEDPELNDILDDALADFDKPPPPPASQEQSQGQSGSPERSPGLTSDWAREFTHDDHVPPNSFVDASAFEKAMEEQIKALEQQIPNLGSLSDFSNDSDDQLEQYLANMNINETTFDDSNLFSAVEDLMRKMLSKDLLYPALKDVVDKYPDWLAEKRNELSVDDFDRYNKQYDLAQKICFQYESSDSSNDQSYQTILSLMQEMQSLGDVPKELTNNAQDDLPLPEQCKVS